MFRSDRLNERGPTRRTKAFLNKLADTVESMRIAQGVGYRVKHTRLGQVLELPPVRQISAGESIIAAFSIQEIQNTYLVCYKLDSSGAITSSTNFSVARAKYLRELPYIGVYIGGSLTWDDTVIGQQRGTYIVRAPATGREYTVTQRIYPYYAVGDTVFAAETAGTGVYEPAGPSLRWLDLNVDGRHWVMDWREFSICIKIDNIDTGDLALMQGSRGQKELT